MIEFLLKRVEIKTYQARLESICLRWGRLLVVSRFFLLVLLFGGKFLLVTLVVRNLGALIDGCSDIFTGMALLFAAKKSILSFTDRCLANCFC